VQNRDLILPIASKGDTRRGRPCRWVRFQATPGKREVSKAADATSDAVWRRDSIPATNPLGPGIAPEAKRRFLSCAVDLHQRQPQFNDSLLIYGLQSIAKGTHTRQQNQTRTRTRRTATLLRVQSKRCFRPVTGRPAGLETCSGKRDDDGVNVCSCHGPRSLHLGPMQLNA
jgi:hypothetical protein